MTADPNQEAAREPENEGGAKPEHDVVRHVLGCSPCGGKLSTLKLQADVVEYLGRRGSSDSQLLVERSLRTAAASGHRALGRAVYEMGWAALFVVPMVQRARELGFALPDLATCRDHAIRLAERADLLGQCKAGPNDLKWPPTLDTALYVSMSVAELLRAIGGFQDHSDILLAATLVEMDRWSEALRTYETLIGRNTDERLALAARSSIIATHIRAGEYSTALNYAEENRSILVSDCNYWFNVATANAWLGNRQDALESLDAFRGLPSKGNVRAWWEAKLPEEAEWFADKLGITRNEAATALGI